MKKILVISPHPDDEAIGCGGTIYGHTVKGDNVEVIFLTSGEKGGHGMPESKTYLIREKESSVAAKILRLTAYEFWKEPDGALQVNASNLQRLKEKLFLFQPDIVYVPHSGEQHHDHRAAAKLVKQAVVETASEVKRPLVRMYEVWTPIQNMNHIENITAYVTIKKKAIRCYKSQCKVMSFDKAILGLNRYRGEMHCWPDGDYAEVFEEMQLDKEV